MRHWDEIIALKERIGVPKDYKAPIHHPLNPDVMTERQRVVAYTFENMTAPAERFLKQKFHLKPGDYIDATLMQELTTCMRVDLFYQTAECRLVPEKQWITVNGQRTQVEGVRVILAAGNRKSVQLHTGVRFDTCEYAAMQLGLDIPLKTAMPVNTEITVRLGKRMMAGGDITVHPRSFTRPTLSYMYHRNDVDVYSKGNLDYNIRYNQSQAELLPFNFNLHHFNLQMGLR